jgi:hypothetical protein
LVKEENCPYFLLPVNLSVKHAVSGREEHYEIPDFVLISYKGSNSWNAILERVLL